MLDARGKIAIAQLVIFAICTPGAIYALVRHGRIGIQAWFFIVAFCVIRLAGAGLLVSAETSGGSEQIALILSSVATGPLLLGVNGILHEIYHSFSVNRYLNVFFIAMHLPITAAVILTAIGGSNLNSSDSSKSSSARGEYEGGAAFMFVLFLFVSGIVLWTWVRHRKDTQPGAERRLLDALFISLPFLFIRFLYSLLSAVVKGHNFGFGGGSPWVYLGMAVLMEFIIIPIYIVAGVTTRPSKSARPEKPHREGRRARREKGHHVDTV